jgi:NADH:ubiquinone oxidoreductase subunit E
MLKVFENIPPTDPLVIIEQRQVIDEILKKNRDVPGAPMVVLNELQSEIGYISTPMQAYVARELQVPMSKISGVISFYSFFTTTPRGKHLVKFCMGTACYVGGAPELLEKAWQLLAVKPGDTTDDGSLTIEVCRCIGACSQAPAVVVDKDVYGRMHPNKLAQVFRKYQQQNQR